MLWHLNPCGSACQTVPFLLCSCDTCAGGGADTFALPLIIGYVGQVVNPVFRQTSSSRSSGSTGKQQGEQQDAAQPQGGEASEQITQQKGDQGPREAADRAAQGGEDAGDEVDAEVDAEVDPGLGWSKYQRHCRRLGEGELSGHITLIARMAARRQGTLLWRKGLDLDGNAAHMIEVEQLVVVDMPGGMQQWLSHVQVGRGSGGARGREFVEKARCWLRPAGRFTGWSDLGTGTDITAAALRRGTESK